MRYLFLCTDRATASGGIAVIYDMVALLNDRGYEAAVVHNSPTARYPDHPREVPAYCTRLVSRTYWRHAGLRAKLSTLRPRPRGRGPRAFRPLELRPTDVIVVPEFQLAEAIEAFGGTRFVVLVQNPFGLMSAYRRAVERGLSPHRSVRYWLSIADVCERHIEILGGPADRACRRVHEAR